MSSPVQRAVETYIRANSEPDLQVRTALFETCLADDARMVTRSREICGRAQLVQEIERFLTDPRLLRIRVTSAVDAKGVTFRYQAVAEFRDGTSAASFDVGEVDETGRISLILTFAGPLGEMGETGESV